MWAIRQAKPGNKSRAPRIGAVFCVQEQEVKLIHMSLENCVLLLALLHHVFQIGLELGKLVSQFYLLLLRQSSFMCRLICIVLCRRNGGRGSCSQRLLLPYNLHLLLCMQPSINNHLFGALVRGSFLF